MIRTGEKTVIASNMRVWPDAHRDVCRRGAVNASTPLSTLVTALASKGDSVALIEWCAGLALGDGDGMLSSDEMKRLFCLGSRCRARDGWAVSLSSDSAARTATTHRTG